MSARCLPDMTSRHLFGSALRSPRLQCAYEAAASGHVTAHATISAQKGAAPMESPVPRTTITTAATAPAIREDLFWLLRLRSSSC
jgi:hypothetical protein